MAQEDLQQTNISIVYHYNDTTPALAKALADYALLIQANDDTYIITTHNESLHDAIVEWLKTLPKGIVEDFISKYDNTNYILVKAPTHLFITELHNKVFSINPKVVLVATGIARKILGDSCISLSTFTVFYTLGLLDYKYAKILMKIVDKMNSIVTDEYVKDKDLSYKYFSDSNSSRYFSKRLEQLREKDVWVLRQDGSFELEKKPVDEEESSDVALYYYHNAAIAEEEVADGLIVSFDTLQDLVSIFADNQENVLRPELLEILSFIESDEPYYKKNIAIYSPVASSKTYSSTGNPYIWGLLDNYPKLRDDILLVEKNIKKYVYNILVKAFPETSPSLLSKSVILYILEMFLNIAQSDTFENQKKVVRMVGLIINDIVLPSLEEKNLSMKNGVQADACNYISAILYENPSLLKNFLTYILSGINYILENYTIKSYQSEVFYQFYNDAIHLKTILEHFFAKDMVLDKEHVKMLNHYVEKIIQIGQLKYEEQLKKIEKLFVYYLEERNIKRNSLVLDFEFNSVNFIHSRFLYFIPHILVHWFSLFSSVSKANIGRGDRTQLVRNLSNRQALVLSNKMYQANKVYNVKRVQSAYDKVKYNELVGPALSLTNVLWLLDFVSQSKITSRNKNINVPVLEQYVEVSSELYNSIKNDLLKGNKMKQIRYESIDKYNSYLASTSSFYSFVQIYYNKYVNDLFYTDIKLKEHQAKAVNAIYEGYKRYNDGFLLAHATGTGKTFTISAAINAIINHRLSEGLSTKVLFISKAEIVNKIAQELPYFCSQYRGMHIVKSADEIYRLLDEDFYPDFLGLSFRLISTLTEKKTFIDEETQEEITVREFQIANLHKLLSAYDIIVIDEAHNIKNLKLMHIDNYYQILGDRPSNMKVFGVDLSPDYVPMPGGLSKIALGLFTFYISYVKSIASLNPNSYKVARKFFILSSGTVIANWPEDSWIQLYMTGLHKDTLLSDFIGKDPYEFALKWFMPNLKGKILQYAKHHELIDYIIQNLIQSGQVIADVGNQTYFRFEKNLLETVDFSQYQNEGFAKSYIESAQNFNRMIELASSKYFLDEYGDLEAYGDGLIPLPQRERIVLRINEEVSKIYRSIKNISEYIDDFQNNVKTFAKSSKHIGQVVYKRLPEGYKSSGRGRKPLETEIGSIDYSNRYKNVLLNILFSKDDDGESLYEKIMKVASKVVSSTKSKLSAEERMDKIKVALIRAVYELHYEIQITNNKMVFEPVIFSKKMTLSKDVPDTPNYGIDDLPDLLEHKFALGVTLNKINSIVRRMLDFYYFSMRSIATAKVPFAMNYVIADILRIWLEIDAGKRLGSGKIIIGSYYMPSATLSAAFVFDFVYNVLYKAMKEQDGINLIDEINNIVAKSVERSIIYKYGLDLARLGMPSEDYLSIILPIIRLSNEAINNILQMIEGVKISDDVMDYPNFNIYSFMESINTLIICSHLITFIRNLGRANKASARFVESAMNDFIFREQYINYEAKDPYGGGFLDFLDSTVGEYISRRHSYDKVSHMLTTPSIDDEYIAKGFSDYMKSIGIFTDEYKNMVDALIQRKVAESRTYSQKYFSNDVMQSIKDMIRKSNVGVTIKKNFLSKRFLHSKSLKIIIANMKSIAEGLDFNNASAIYILEILWSVGLMSQLEARVARVGGAKFPFKIVYVTSDMRNDLRMVNSLITKEFVSLTAMQLGKRMWYDLIGSNTLTIRQIRNKHELIKVFDYYKGDLPSIHEYMLWNEEDKYFFKVLDRDMQDKLKLIGESIKDIQQNVEEGGSE
jgi:hypothetical protein